jgi:DNA polymerase-1
MQLSLNIGGNEAEAECKQEALKEAVKRKQAVSETIEDAFERVGKLKLDEKQFDLFKTAKKAYENGAIGRLRDGKLSKDEVLEMGRKIKAEEAEKLRQQRLRETFASKPSNYYILTDDSELPTFIERVREEVKLQAQKWANRFEKLGVKSITAGDFEGTGIDAYIDLSIGFSIWLPILDEGFYLAYGHVDTNDAKIPRDYAFKEGDKQLTRSKVLEAITPYLSHKDHGKTFHMGAARYDLHIAENDGYTIKGCVWDTLDAMNTLNEHEEAYGLKPLVQKYGPNFGIDASSVFTFEDLFGNCSPAPYNTEIVGIYAINDVKYGWKLFEFQFEMMKKTHRLFECYSQVDSGLPETDVFMERCGFRVDNNKLSELESEFIPKIEEAKARVFETYNIDEEFVRKMDRTINAKKIAKWIADQKTRIEKCQAKVTIKESKIRDIEAQGKTHTKMYQQEIELLKKYKTELSSLDSPIEDNAPQEIKEFSMTNGNHLAYLIYDYLGIEDKTYKVDRNKKRSTAANVLEMYYEDEPKLEPLATVAEYEKLLSTYIRPIIGSNGIHSVKEVDGRLHSNFKAGGTATGRYSSSSYNARPIDILEGFTEVTDDNYFEIVKRLVTDDSKVKKGVNLQNIASKGDGKRVRNCFVPNDGWFFIGSDLGQIEPRIQAHIMYTKYGDNSMRQIFVDGVDLYTTMAMKTFNLAEEYCVDKAYDPTGKFQPRKLMKTGVLAVSYDQKPASFAQKMGVSMEIAEFFFENFDKSFPSFRQMVADIREGMKKTGYVETLFGRKRRFPDYKRVSAEVKRNENVLMQYYIERKRLNGKKSKTEKDKARLAELKKLIDPLAEKRGLVAYWERAAFNAVIQGTGADILKMNGNRMARECMSRGWELNASIHDELKISVPAKDLTEETIALVKEIMTETVSISVPLVTDTVIEPKWMEEYSPDEWDFENCKPKE